MLPRILPTLFSSLSLFACIDIRKVGDDELGSTTTDTDTDTDTTDATTGEPVFAACEFEWVTHLPTAEGTTQQVYFAPLVLADDELTIAHQAGLASAIDTRLTRLSQTDGALVESVLLTLVPDGKDYPQSLARLPEGDHLLGFTNYMTDGAHVSRVKPDGEEVWRVVDNDHMASYVVLGLGLRPKGEVVALMTRQVGVDDTDLALVGYAAASGTVLWTHEFGGDAIGESFDHGGALDIADDGGLIVGMDERIDANTTAPVVLGFDPGEPVVPIWSTRLVDRPGETVYMISLDQGPTGLVVAGALDELGKFWISGLDAATGELRWQVERDELELPAVQESNLGAVAVSAERVLVAGNWLTTVGGDLLNQGFVLEFDLDGNLICHSTVDDRDPETGTFEYSWEFRDVEVGEQGEFLLSGFRIPYWNPMKDIDLLAAKVH